MPRRKQSNPQPVKLGLQSSEAALSVDHSCLVLDSDFLLSGDLEFGDSEIIGLDKDSVTVFSLSVEEDCSVTSDPSLSFCSCKRCGKLLPDALLSTGITLGVDLDLTSDLCCLSCEEQVHSPLSPSKPPRPPAKSAAPHGNPDTSPHAKLFSCSLCPFTSRYSNHLKRHARIHAGHKPFGCGVCPYASTQLVNLQRHLRTHTGEKPYRCQTCHYACSSLGNLRRHQRTHAAQEKKKREDQEEEGEGEGKREKKRKRQEKEKVSSLSQSGFLSLGSLSSSSPLPALLFPVLCQVCGLAVEEEDVHGDRGDADAEGQVCRRCSSSSSSPTAMPRPRRKSAKNTLYRCSFCPFFSRYHYHLTRHLLTHDSTKSHHCPHCPYASSHPDNLKRHLRVHTGEKPFHCASCSYACGNLANLKRHERVHTGAKPFQCCVCGYSCNQSMNLKRHMLRHSGYKPYECVECSYTTGHWDNYKRHQRKHGHNADDWDKRKYKTKSTAPTDENIQQEGVDCTPTLALQHEGVDCKENSTSEQNNRSVQGESQH